MRHEFPDDYLPLNFCRGCGRDFTGEGYFDRHRVGSQEYTFAEGLAFDPPVEDGRRCMDADELEAAGLRPMTDEEMAGKYRNRIGSGVALYWDPVQAARFKQHHIAASRPMEALSRRMERLPRAA